MIQIFHDFDDENYKETLESAFEKYMNAAYGNAEEREISEIQYGEVRLAFFSGVHWLCGRDSYDPYEIQSVLRTMLDILPKESDTDEEE